MRNVEGCLARLAPRFPPRFPACAAIVLTILILERMLERTPSLLLLVGTTNPFFFFFLFATIPTADKLRWSTVGDDGDDGDSFNVTPRSMDEGDAATRRFDFAFGV